MAKDPNMKIIIGADTKDFDKGAQSVKQGLRDLDKTTASAMDSVGKAFGVNTGKVGQFTSALTGLGAKLSECGNAGVKAFGNILKSIGPIETALAGIGLSAAIAGFRELQKEANAFKQTVEGANIEMATAAYVDTYRQVLRDMSGETGKTMANIFSSLAKFGGEFKAIISDYFTSGAFINPMGTAQSQAGKYPVAEENARKAEELTNRIYELERRRKEQAVDLAKLNDDIAAKMQVAKDATASIAEREDAIYKIELMLSQKRAMTVDLETRLADLYRERSGLATDGVEAADATLAQEARKYEVERAITQEETALLRVKNSIGKATDAEIARMNKLLEQQKKLQESIAATRSRWAGMAEALSGIGDATGASVPGVTAPSLSILPRKEDVELFKEAFTAQLGDFTIGVGIKADVGQVHDITKEVVSLVESATVRTSEILGGLVGTLVGGGDAWGDFKDAALAAFGDMAIAVGKIAISVGVADMGIQMALKSGQWQLAIAAGAALVALGSAVKSSLSAVASGDYSAGGGGYSGNYSSGGSVGGYETREVNVYVTGTLEAEGDKLITVINNANKKAYYTK
jgi:hypothetical protein